MEETLSYRLETLSVLLVAQLVVMLDLLYLAVETSRELEDLESHLVEMYSERLETVSLQEDRVPFVIQGTLFH
jgi:hypothetical protein